MVVGGGGGGSKWRDQNCCFQSTQRAVRWKKGWIGSATCWISEGRRKTGGETFQWDIVQLSRISCSRSSSRVKRLLCKLKSVSLKVWKQVLGDRLAKTVQRRTKHLTRAGASRLPSYSHRSIQEVFSMVGCGWLFGGKLILQSKSSLI